MKAAYQTHVIYQRVLFDSPGEITEMNWKDHLGDEKYAVLVFWKHTRTVSPVKSSRYYRAYLTFFSNYVLEHGISASLENFVFSDLANWDDNIEDGKQQPQMFNRLVSGLIHPLIHVGHACEFNSPGMLAEGQ